MDSHGPRFGIDLARAGAGHRSHPPIARALRGNGMADRRRQYLWESAAYRRAASSSAFARGNGANFKEQASRQSDIAGARAHAREARCLRLAANDRKMKLTA